MFFDVTKKDFENTFSCRLENFESHQVALFHLKNFQKKKVLERFHDTPRPEVSCGTMHVMQRFKIKKDRSQAKLIL